MFLCVYVIIMTEVADFSFATHWKISLMLIPLQNFHCPQELYQQLQNTHLTDGNQFQPKVTISHIPKSME